MKTYFIEFLFPDVELEHEHFGLVKAENEAEAIKKANENLNDFFNPEDAELEVEKIKLISEEDIKVLKKYHSEVDYY